MACKGCGSSDFKERLGACPYCMMLATISAIACWLLFFFLWHSTTVKLLYWLVAGFASLVTLLLIAHVFAYLSKQKTTH